MNFAVITKVVIKRVHCNKSDFLFASLDEVALPKQDQILIEESVHSSWETMGEVDGDKLFSLSYDFL